MDAHKSETELREELARLRERGTALEADVARHQQVEQSLRDTALNYRIIADFTDGWEYWRNPEGLLRYVSPACERITGYTPAQFLARDDLLCEIVLPEDRAVFEAHRQQTGDVPGPYEVHFRIRRADGAVRWIEHACQPVYDETGAFWGWRASNRDITDRKRDELALQDSRQTLETLMRNLPGMAYRCQNDHDWTMEFLSDGCKALTGYDPADLLQSAVISFADLIHPDDREAVWHSVQDSLRAGEPYEMFYRLQTRYGKEKWVWEQGREITLNDGRTCLEGLITDITLRIRVEEALRRSEARSRALLDAVPDLMLNLDRDGIFLRYHDAGMGTHVPPMEFLGQSIDDVMPALAGRTRYAIDRALKSREVQILQYQLPLGDDIRDYEARIVASGDDEVVVIVREITARVQAERALRASEERLRTLIHATPDIICFKDSDGRWLLANEAILNVFGLTEANYRGQTDLELAEISHGHHEVLVNCHATDEQAWAKGALSRADEVIPRPDGEERTYDVIKVPLFHPDGKRKGLIVLGRDITERKRSEELLHRREQEFRALADNNPDLIVRFDRDCRHLYVNPAVSRMTGIAYEDFIGRTPADLGMPENLVARWNVTIGRAFKIGQPVESEFAFDTAENGPRDFHSHAMPEFAEDGSVQTVLVRIRDITERKEAEEQRIKLAVERERVSVLASFLENVSHEFRTPLSVIYTGLEALERSALLDESNVQRVGRIQEQAGYIGRLVDSMITMSRLDGDPNYVFDFHDLGMVMHDIKHDIERLAQLKQLAVSLDLPDDLPFVYCDPYELRRALFAICENAVDYTPEGGSITIRASHNPAHVLIEVADTGIGIAASDLPHIFERFYRADKARTGRRAGLGLAIARTIIEAHQGRIDVQSAANQGSTFRVTLPLMASQ